LAISGLTEFANRKIKNLPLYCSSEGFNTPRNLSLKSICGKGGDPSAYASG